MIYAAVLFDGQLEKVDFENIVAHNSDFEGMKFKGKLDIAQIKVPEGSLSQFVYRLKDENETSNDLTFVVMFNKTRENKSLEEYQFILNRHSEQIQTFLDDLCDEVDPEDVEMKILANGNILYVLKDCDLKPLEKQFTKSARNKMKAV